MEMPILKICVRDIILVGNRPFIAPTAEKITVGFVDRNFVVSNLYLSLTNLLGRAPTVFDISNFKATHF